MFDPFFTWLEATALSVWMVESPSLFAFPFVLALHTIGLGLVAGLSVALDLRLLGLASAIPVVEFRRFVPLMWAGFALNAASGILLVIAYPTKALTNPLFYAKLALIAGALVILTMVRRRVLEGEVTRPVPRSVKMLAVASLICWALATIAGRYLAYTYTRLTVNG